MTELYYQSPEKAIYMRRFFKIRLVDQFGRPIRFEMRMRSLEFVPMHHPDGRSLPCHGAFVHINSYKILLPRKGDLVRRSPLGAVDRMEENYNNNAALRLSGDSLALEVLKASTQMETIWRRGNPFIQPMLAIWKREAQELVLSKWQHE